LTSTRSSETHPGFKLIELAFGKDSKAMIEVLKSLGVQELPMKESIPLITTFFEKASHSFFPKIEIVQRENNELDLDDNFGI
ncbi:MAG TPA: hypothetical protein VIY47_00050, partial [Ignavibacteriaceae bacterium]